MTQTLVNQAYLLVPNTCVTLLDELENATLTTLRHPHRSNPCRYLSLWKRLHRENRENHGKGKHVEATNPIIPTGNLVCQQTEKLVQFSNPKEKNV